MNRCPHCRVRVHLSRLLTYSRRRPYRCPCCGRRARFRDLHDNVLGGIGAGLVGVLATMHGDITLESMALAVTCACAFVQAAQATVLRLEPLPEDAPPRPPD